MARADELSDEDLFRLLRDGARHVDAPEDVIRRAVNVFRVRPQARRDSLLDRIVAVLTFDSAAVSPLALGVRGEAAPSRQLLFSAEGRDIDLRIAPAATAGSGDFEVSGQVLGPDSGGTIVLDGGEQRRTAQLNELSEFSFSGVPAGDYTLTLHLQGTVVVVPALHLSPGA